MSDHSLETKIALLELQVKNLADALLIHMEQQAVSAAASHGQARRRSRRRLATTATRALTRYHQPNTLL